MQTENLLGHEDLVLFCDLLATSGLCDDDEARTALIRRVKLQIHQVNRGGTSENFSMNFIGELSEAGNVHTLNLVLGILEEKVVSPQAKSDVYHLKRILNTTHFHIITSSKGGVGKTLCALATAFLYYKKSSTRGLLCLDANTMNPDLYRILSAFKTNEGTPEIEDPRHTYRWARSLIGENVHALRSHQPYAVYGGAISFWDSIRQLVRTYNSERILADYDMIVDTNLHIANLRFSRSSAEEAALQKLPTEVRKQLPIELNEEIPNVINDILNDAQATIYVWLFWTWASFQQPELEEIANTIRYFHKNFGNRVSIVHVLNPSALMLPEIVFPPTVEDYEKQIEIWLAEKFKWEPEMDRRGVKNSLRRLQQNIDDFRQEIRRLPNYTKSAVPGLANLAAATVVPPIPFEGHDLSFLAQVVRLFENYDDGSFLSSEISDQFESQPDTNEQDNFERLVDREKQTFVILKDRMIEKFQGCPANILPISTHEPHLRGYTELFARSKPDDIETLGLSLQSIIDDVEKFIEHLAPAE